MHAIQHALTPGTPVYGALKFGALGSFFALRFALGRRSRTQAERTAAERAAEAAAHAGERGAARGPHPRSRKKRRRR